MRVVLTGGPCSGKSTVIDHLRAYSPAPVVVVPEIATLMFGHGVPNVAHITDVTAVFDAELAMMRLQVAMEDSCHLASKVLVEPIMVMDRGLLDYKAYVTPDMWNRLQLALRMDEEQMMARYDVVYHLPTAPAEHYTTANNQSRTETYAEATARSVAAHTVWQHHPEYWSIPKPIGGVAEKANSVLRAITSHLTGCER